MYTPNHVETLKDCLEEYLHRKGIKNTRNTFRCLNPEHRDSTPSMQYYSDSKRVYCFGCRKTYDVIDLIKIDEGITDYKEAVKYGCQMFGIPMDNTTPYAPKPTQKPQNRPVEEEPKTVDYSAYYQIAAARIAETDYHRGISLETLRRYHIGFDPLWKQPLQFYMSKKDRYPDRTPEKWQNIPLSPRLIIPTGKSTYFARDTREGLTEDQKKYAKQNVGGSELFNAEALYDAERPIFIVEAELDALSIIDIGGMAVGLGGTCNVNKLANLIKEKHPVQPLVLLLDNDDPGQEAEKELYEKLNACNVCCIRPVATIAQKDANEALNADREGLKKAVEANEAAAAKVYAEYIKVQTAAKEQALEAESAKSLEEAFEAHIKRTKEQPIIKTGLTSFDALLGGQLFTGLYFIGAVSSLGKTTFLLQIADFIAHSGRDVLFYSLEMSQYELIAKSISRISFERSKSEEGTNDYAASTRNILNGNAKEHDSAGIIARSTRQYFDSIAHHIFIKEGQGNITVQDIAAAVKDHTEKAGIAPVVMIDYLQILAPSDQRLTDKQNVDKAVVELKRISRDYNTPVLAISSLNRDNYTAPINLAAYKESGAIEYSSDFLIGLQYAGMDYEPGESSEKGTRRTERITKLIREEKEKGRKGKAERIQLKLLKNRNGAVGDIELDYTPMFNTYWDTTF